MQEELMFLHMHANATHWEDMAAALPPHSATALAQLWHGLVSCDARGGPLLDTYVAAVVRGRSLKQAFAFSVNSLSKSER
jgi:hypothetical protein